MRTLALRALLAASVAACELPSGMLPARSGSPAPAASATDCADPIKCSPPPPGYTPYVAPPCDAPLTTADEIRAAANRRGFVAGSPGEGLGEPILVRAMAPGDRDEWLVPWMDGQGGASGVVVVSVNANGRGCGGMSSGWSGPFPRISMEAARRRTAGPNDPVVFIEAVHFPYTMSLPPASDAQMVWRAVRQSGREVFLFGSGDLVEGYIVRARFDTPLRGESAGATPRPQPAVPAFYAVATADQALAGAMADPFVIEQLRYLRAETGEPHPAVADPWLDRPIRVLGLHKPYTVDLWIVPVRDRGGAIVSLISIGDRDGRGQAGEARAWSGPFPRVSEADAKRLGSLADDPAISAQLGWAEAYYISPGGPTAVGWLVTRRSGARVVVTEEGSVAAEPK